MSPCIGEGILAFYYLCKTDEQCRSDPPDDECREDAWRLFAQSGCVRRCSMILAGARCASSSAFIKSM